MKRKWLLLLTSVLLLSGCGKEESQLSPESSGEEKTVSQETDTEEKVPSLGAMKNGDHISYALTDQAKLEADVVLPEDWTGKAELCHIKLGNFEADALAGKLFPDIGKEKWESYGPEFCSYTDDGKDILIEEGIYYYTYNWWEQEAYFPLNQQWTKEDEFVQELPFASREEIAAQAEEWLTEQVGLEQVRIDRIYSIPKEKIFEEYQRRNASLESDGKQSSIVRERNAVSDFDDCYWLDITRYVNGLPLLGDSFTRQDETYVPDGEILMGFTEHGMEDAILFENYEITGIEERQLCPVKDVLVALKKKFELTISTDITIDGMQLIYFPFPVSAKEQTYELIPTWEFSFTEGGRKQHVYINGLDGKEIVS